MLSLLVLAFAGLGVAAFPSFAQRPYTVARPPERSTTERVVIRSVPVQRTKGVLAVVLTPIINGKVIVKDASGSIVAEANAGERGQAEFELPRRKAYQVEATYDGYFSATDKTKPLGSTEIVRLTLKPQFAKLELPGLPPEAQVFIDGQLRATAGASGTVTLSDLAPGNPTLTVRHPEHNDYKTTLAELKAGDEVTLPMRPLLTKVAKLSIQSLPGATVYIDGEVQGRVNANGQVQIDYQLAQAAEHTITVELLGYQPWSHRELLKPGPREFIVKLDPIITSEGASDFFDNLAQWSAPSTWAIAKEKDQAMDTNKLQVSGSALGLFKNKIYRDFDAVFTVWLKDGKGATWAVRADQAGRNYYLFHLTGLRTSELTPRRLYTYRIKDGQLTELQTPTPITFDFKEKDSYTIFVTVRGNQITHRFVANSTAEESEASVTDTLADKDQFLFGTFGFLSLKGETFQVDDFTIQPSQ